MAKVPNPRRRDPRSITPEERELLRALEKEGLPPESELPPKIPFKDDSILELTKEQLLGGRDVGGEGVQQREGGEPVPVRLVDDQLPDRGASDEGADRDILSNIREQTRLIRDIRDSLRNIEDVVTQG